MNGIPVSPGVALGRAAIKKEQQIDLKKSYVTDIPGEIKRLQAAKDTCKRQLTELYSHALESIGENDAEIFKAHIMMLDDPELYTKVEQQIQEEGVSAGYALKNVSDMYIGILENMDNEYMKERAADIRDVVSRLSRILLGVEDKVFYVKKEDTIVIAADLTPSDTAQMDRKKVVGFITEVGGRTSHSAILARTLGIPAVSGVKDILYNVSDDDFVVFDGSTGEIIVNPKPDVVTEFILRKKDYEKSLNNLHHLVGAESRTKDGIKVELSANIGTPDDINNVLENDGEGIGLYRTEFLYMDKDHLPAEEELFEAYKAAIERMEGKPVVIRTLDIGGDKELPYLGLDKESNPFLGYRAIRYCLDRKDIFKTQLRAILRASIFGNVKIMFPMISGIEEVREAKKMVAEVKRELSSEGIHYADNIQIGIMIEIPSAALISDLLAKEVDFFSIGTNDLLQYTIAVDRGNQKVAHLYSNYHPAFLRLIKLIVDNGHKENIQVCMCGEAAGDPKLIPLLVGMGLDELSMNPASILKARQIIRNISQAEMNTHISQILNLSSSYDTERYIDENI